MIDCGICKNPTNNKRYCSRLCSEKGKFGRKRPDLVTRNKTNNPVWDEIARNKMANSLRGKVHSEETKKKRRDSIAKKRLEDPTFNARQSHVIVQMNLDKPMGWKRMRLAALERDGYVCQECHGQNRRVIVHHKDHMGRSVAYSEMNNSLDNLITLCYSCHNKIHLWTVIREEAPKLV